MDLISSGDPGRRPAGDSPGLCIPTIRGKVKVIPTIRRGDGIMQCGGCVISGIFSAVFL